MYSSAETILKRSKSAHKGQFEQLQRVTKIPLTLESIPSLLSIRKQTSFPKVQVMVFCQIKNIFKDFLQKTAPSQIQAGLPDGFKQTFMEFTLDRFTIGCEKEQQDMLLYTSAIFVKYFLDQEEVVNMFEIIQQFSKRDQKTTVLVFKFLTNFLDVCQNQDFAKGFRSHLENNFQAFLINNHFDRFLGLSLHAINRNCKKRMSEDWFDQQGAHSIEDAFTMTYNISLEIVENSLLLAHKILTYDYLHTSRNQLADQFAQQRSPILLPSKKARSGSYQFFDKWLSSSDNIYRHLFLFFKFRSRLVLQNVLVDLMGDFCRVHLRFCKDSANLLNLIQNAAFFYVQVIKCIELDTQTDYKFALNLGSNLIKLFSSNLFFNIDDATRNSLYMAVGNFVKLDICQNVISADLVTLYLGFIMQLKKKVSYQRNQVWEEQVIQTVSDVGKIYERELYADQQQKANNCKIRVLDTIKQALRDFTPQKIKSFVFFFGIYKPNPPQQGILGLCSEFQHYLFQYLSPFSTERRVTSMKLNLTSLLRRIQDIYMSNTQTCWKFIWYITSEMLETSSCGRIKIEDFLSKSGINVHLQTFAFTMIDSISYTEEMINNTYEIVIKIELLINQSIEDPIFLTELIQEILEEKGKFFRNEDSQLKMAQILLFILTQHQIPQYLKNENPFVFSNSKKLNNTLNRQKIVFGSSAFKKHKHFQINQSSYRNSLNNHSGRSNTIKQGFSKSKQRRQNSGQSDKIHRISRVLPNSCKKVQSNSKETRKKSLKLQTLPSYKLMDNEQSIEKQKDEDQASYIEEESQTEDLKEKKRKKYIDRVQSYISKSTLYLYACTQTRLQNRNSAKAKQQYECAYRAIINSESNFQSFKGDLNLIKAFQNILQIESSADYDRKCVIFQRLAPYLSNQMQELLKKSRKQIQNGIMLTKCQYSLLGSLYLLLRFANYHKRYLIQQKDQNLMNLLEIAKKFIERLVEDPESIRKNFTLIEKYLNLIKESIFFYKQEIFLPVSSKVIQLYVHPYLTEDFKSLTAVFVDQLPDFRKYFHKKALTNLILGVQRVISNKNNEIFFYKDLMKRLYQQQHQMLSSVIKSPVFFNFFKWAAKMDVQTIQFNLKQINSHQNIGFEDRKHETDDLYKGQIDLDMDQQGFSNESANSNSNPNNIPDKRNKRKRKGKRKANVKIQRKNLNAIKEGDGEQDNFQDDFKSEGSAEDTGNQQEPYFEQDTQFMHLQAKFGDDEQDAQVDFDSVTRELD